jgi:hypothetical protein
VKKYFAGAILAWVAVTQSASIWGGDHIQIDVTRDGARIELDCAHGTMDQAPRADAKGAFKVKGTFVPERSGPTQDDKAPAPKAVYSGTIKDDTMTLRIVVDGHESDALTYELTRGQRGNIRKCR